jgi:hypothetical protein
LRRRFGGVSFRHSRVEPQMRESGKRHETALAPVRPRRF